jgi:hypothetical protein
MLAMNYKELDEMWHDIREKMAEADKGISNDELARRANERALPIMEELGLRFADIPKTTDK